MVAPIYASLPILIHNRRRLSGRHISREIRSLSPPRSIQFSYSPEKLTSEIVRPRYPPLMIIVDSTETLLKTIYLWVHTGNYIYYDSIKDVHYELWLSNIDQEEVSETVMPFEYLQEAAKVMTILSIYRIFQFPSIVSSNYL